MPKEWPAQPRFLEVLKTLRSASKVKLDELESLALADARQYYKHAVAILVKQLQVKRPRQRVPILYAINTLATHARDADVGKIYAGRFAPEIVACVAAALKCPPTTSAACAPSSADGAGAALSTRPSSANATRSSTRTRAAKPQQPPPPPRETKKPTRRAMT